jgi:hypothetical protein
VRKFRYQSIVHRIYHCNNDKSEQVEKIKSFTSRKVLVASVSGASCFYAEANGYVASIG